MKDNDELLPRFCNLVSKDMNQPMNMHRHRIISYRAFELFAHNNGNFRTVSKTEKLRLCRADLKIFWWIGFFPSLHGIVNRC